MIDLTPYTDSNGDIDLKKELIQKLAGIVDSGSNENGRYVQFEDGTMITYSLVNHTIPTANSNPKTGVLTFPATFIATPMVSVSNRRTSAYSVVDASISGNVNQYPTSTSYMIQWYEITAGLSFPAGVTVSAMVIAIGRWK